MIDFLESIIPVWIVSAIIMVSVLLVGIGYCVRAVQENIVIDVLKRRCERVEAENRALSAPNRGKIGPDDWRPRPQIIREVQGEIGP